MITSLSMDYETYSDVELTGAKSVGLDNYMRHESTEALMLAYTFNDDVEKLQQLDFTDGASVPNELRDALLDPHVEKWGFNSQFERRATIELLGIQTPTQGWRCTMALSYMRSFTGGLGDVGIQLGLSDEHLKDPRGKALIKKFSVPQKLTKANPFRRRTRETDPEEWEYFLSYNRRDVPSEIAIKQRLIRYPILPSEWLLYEIDQEINDTGLPVNREFVRNAIHMCARRKEELIELMEGVTHLRRSEGKNVNSGKQLLVWLKERGYPFDDLQKNTVKKVLVWDEAELRKGGEGILHPSANACLKLRQQASRTSVKKYDAMLRRLSADNFLRFCFQFAGAARTNRWAGRGPQPQNLVRTPKLFADPEPLEVTSRAIERGDFSALELLCEEPMEALAGLIRSAFQAPEGWEFVVCDLHAIESAVIAWIAKCLRLLRVFEEGLDPYIDFGTALYNKLYELITKYERGICKPAVLGCGFGLGGGKEFRGKRTGLWGYAESMGVDITQEDAHRQVAVFRERYPEIPILWRKHDTARMKAMNGEEATVNGMIKYVMRGKFMTMELPSGRLMFYYRPKFIRKEFEGRNGPYTREVFTCMGMSQITKRWGRIQVPGPKATENAVQAIARDCLKPGIIRAHKAGFRICGTVHDELITLRRKGDNYLSLELLNQCMTEKESWMKGLPLKAAGYVSTLYKKD